MIIHDLYVKVRINGDNRAKAIRRLYLEISDKVLLGETREVVRDNVHALLTNAYERMVREAINKMVETRTAECAIPSVIVDYDIHSDGSTISLRCNQSSNYIDVASHALTIINRITPATFRDYIMQFWIKDLAKVCCVNAASLYEMLLTKSK